MRLKGKVALIAGGARNIGRAISLTYAREGADLVILARHISPELQETARECQSMGVQTLPLAADVSRSDQVDAALARGLDRFGKIDILASVAGLRPHKPFWEISIEEWHQVLDVNLSSTFYLARTLAPGMMKSGTGGSIIALGGIASLTGQPLRAHVIASKTGLYGLIKAIALELGPHGVRANLIAVGNIDTTRNTDWYAETEHIAYRSGGATAQKNEFGRTDDGKTPLKRLGTAQEVANVALFLASDESSYVTGDRIVCAGGRYM